MLKLMGSICVLGGGLLCWLTALAERRRTRMALGDLLAALRRMREEIRMARTPLPLLLEALPLSLEEIFIYELGGEDYAVRDIVL